MTIRVAEDQTKKYIKLFIMEQYQDKYKYKENKFLQIKHKIRLLLLLRLCNPFKLNLSKVVDLC
jgi:hypothetical protein